MPLAYQVFHKSKEFKPACSRSSAQPQELPPQEARPAHCRALHAQIRPGPPRSLTNCRHRRPGRHLAGPDPPLCAQRHMRRVVTINDNEAPTHHATLKSGGGGGGGGGGGSRATGSCSIGRPPVDLRRPAPAATRRDRDDGRPCSCRCQEGLRHAEQCSGGRYPGPAQQVVPCPASAAAAAADLGGPAPAASVEQRWMWGDRLQQQRDALSRSFSSGGRFPRCLEAIVCSTAASG